MPIGNNARFGAYQLISRLGSGGMGEVYLANDLKLDRHVAIKFLSARAQEDPVLVKRFLREARAASALNHPNIVSVYESGEAESSHFIVMELLRGQTLRERIGNKPSRDDFVHLCLQMTRGLAAAHAANIVHRDIKPENLMVRDDGSLKILDFGLAHRSVQDESSASTLDLSGNSILGTPRYMSPEQARGEALTAATDVFSLGVVFYEFATGKHPFESESQLGVLHAILNEPVIPPSRLNPDLSGTLEMLILRMLQKSPRLRPSSSELEAILAEPAAIERSDAAVVRKTAAIVGRDKDREQFQSAFIAAAAGKGTLLCVEGEAGLGKTTLVEDFLADVSTVHQCFVGRGHSLERLAGTEGYAPLIEAIESLMYGAEGTWIARVAKLLAPTWYVRAIPVAADDSQVSSVLRDAQAASPDRIRREFSSFLHEVSTSRPLIIFLDDLHWADISTIDLLLSIAGQVSGLPVMIIVTYRLAEMHLARNGFLRVKDDLQARGFCQTVALEFLTRQNLQQYIDIQFPGQDFPSGFITLLHSRTEGNALFIVDTLRYLHDQRVIVQQAGQWVLAKSVSDIDRQLPDSIRALIHRNLDMLAADQKRLLLAASVQGFEFHASLVAKVLELDPAEVEEQLDSLDSVHGFVRLMSEETLPDGTVSLRYRFVHSLYQSALYNSLKPARRTALSAGFAQLLEQAYRDQTAVVASQLAFLFDAARNFGHSASYFHKAAQVASYVFAFEEAAQLARRGLAVAQQLENGTSRARIELLLRLELGAALIRAKGFGDTEAQQSFALAYELRHAIEPGLELGTVLGGLGAFELVRLNLKRVRSVGEELIDLGQRIRSAELVTRGQVVLGAVCYFNGDFTEAVATLENPLNRFETGEFVPRFHFYNVNSTVSCLTMIARSLMIMGFTEQARDRIRRAIKIADSLSDPVTQCWAYFYAAMISQATPDLSVQRLYVDNLLSRANEHDLKYWKAHAAALKGSHSIQEGNPEKGIPVLRAGLDAIRAAGSQASVPYFTAMLATALGEQGRFQEALAILEPEMIDLERNRISFGEMCRVRAELLAQLPTPAEEVDQWFARAVTIAEQQKAKLHQARALTSWIRRRSQGVDTSPLRLQLAALLETFTEGFDAVDVVAAERLIKTPPLPA